MKTYGLQFAFNQPERFDKFAEMVKQFTALMEKAKESGATYVAVTVEVDV